MDTSLAAYHNGRKGRVTIHIATYVAATTNYPLTNCLVSTPGELMAMSWLHWEKGKESDLSV